MEVPYPANWADHFVALDEDWRWSRRQELSAALNHVLAIAIREKPEMRQSSERLFRAAAGS